MKPLPVMLEGSARLNAAGATRIAIACTTAHYWFDALALASHAFTIHIADATLAARCWSRRPAHWSGAGRKGWCWPRPA